MDPGVLRHPSYRSISLCLYSSVILVLLSVQCFGYKRTCFIIASTTDLFGKGGKQGDSPAALFTRPWREGGKQGIPLRPRQGDSPAALFTRPWREGGKQGTPLRPRQG